MQTGREKWRQFDWVFALYTLNYSIIYPDASYDPNIMNPEKARCDCSCCDIFLAKNQTREARPAPAALVAALGMNLMLPKRRIYTCA